MPVTRRGLSEYYGARAPEYDHIYRRSERRRDLRCLAHRLPSLLAGREILEVACGTGYWTCHLARCARRLVATDLRPETLGLARAKRAGPAPVDFRIADAFDLRADLGVFDGAFAGFWWSHVPRESMKTFLMSLHGRLEPGAAVVVLDNLYVDGSSTPVVRRDEHGNSYQLRTLGDGTTWEVLKNFPEEGELREALSGFATAISFTRLEYYWFLYYEVAG